MVHDSHYSDLIMSAMASQITGVLIVYKTYCSGTDQRKHQSSTSLVFMRGIHRWPVNSPHKGPVTRKMSPCDGVIMWGGGGGVVQIRRITAWWVPASVRVKRSTIYNHYDDVIMSTMASQITSPTVVYSTVYSDADQRKHQSSASLAFVWGIHRERWIPRTKGQLRGKCFHLMTSSCERLFSPAALIVAQTTMHSASPLKTETLQNGNLSSLVAPMITIIASGATSDGKVGILMTLGFQLHKICTRFCFALFWWVFFFTSTLWLMWSMYQSSSGLFPGFGGIVWTCMKDMGKIDWGPFNQHCLILPPA